MNREAAKLELESMLDSGLGVSDVLGLLADVCREKAAWVESPESVGLPDRRAAKAWDRCAALIERIAASMINPV